MIVNSRGSYPSTMAFEDSNTAVKSLYPDGCGILKESYIWIALPKVFSKEFKTDLTFLSSVTTKVALAISVKSAKSSDYISCNLSVAE